jgi:alpha-L-fucosidase
MVIQDVAFDPARGQRDEAREDPRLGWWRAAKFGMFIHWGLYAIPAGQWQGQPVPGIGEWIMYRARIPVAEYEPLAAQFNPVAFDAAEWVSLAKRAGQKYLVITSKHHDGFCLFRTRMTDYNIVAATPFGRDPMAELAAECARQSIHFGFYYSQTQDWHHPDGDGNDWDYDVSRKDFAAYIEDYVKPQVRELLTNYGPIAVIWFDTPKGISAAQSRSLVELCHQIQPDCLVCGRVGNSLGDYASAGDNKIPQGPVPADWETPATINDTWGYKQDDDNWKSVEDLTHKLIDIVSKGGNYLLNVGPTAEGVIPQPSAERLGGVGQWLQVNGEAIYGTQPGSVQGISWCRTTARPGRLYLHVLDWPQGGTLRVPDIPGRVTGAYLLADPAHAPLRVTQAGGDATIRGPAAAPDPVASVVVLETDA